MPEVINKIKVRGQHLLVDLPIGEYFVHELSDIDESEIQLKIEEFRAFHLYHGLRTYSEAHAQETYIYWLDVTLYVEGIK